MGNIETTPEELIRAEYRRLTRNAKVKKTRRQRRRKGGSVKAISGGLPGLGKRR